MKYHNPITFLEKMNGAPVDTGNAAALSLLRKKMLAELELAEDKLLQIAGQSFSKNDLLLFFDQLQSTADVAYHQQIAKDPVLSYFLETGKIAGLFANNPLYKQRAFLSFISPYYEPLFTAAVIDSLKQQQVNFTRYLFTNPLLMDGAHMTGSYQRILRYLKIQEEQLKITIAKLNDAEEIPWKALSVFANNNLVSQLNILPEEFHQQRSDYGISMINLALALYLTDFKHGIVTLTLVEQLHTTDYVQERNKVRKEALLVYNRQRRANMSLVQWIGHFIEPVRPRWLSDKVLGLACMVIVVVAAGAVNFRSMKKQDTPVVNKDFFEGARTEQQMKYLVAQLQYFSPGENGVKPVADSTLTTPPTGSDVYGSAFMNALMGGKYVDPTPSPKPAAEITSRVAGIDSTAYADPLHKQSLRIFNRLNVSVIMLVQTPDSFYSCFIRPHDSTFVPLQLALNRVYFYVGQLWTPAKEALKSMNDTASYRVKGFFLLNYKDADTFLKDGSLAFKLDPDYWRTSNRYIPIEVLLSDEDKLQLNLMENNTAGVEMYTGE